MNISKQQQIGKILVDKNLISQEKFDSVNEASTDFLDNLINDDFLSESEIYEAIADQYHITFVCLDGFTITVELFNELSAKQALHFEVVPYAIEDDILKIVTANIFESHLEEKLETITGWKIQLLASTPTAIKETLKRSEGTAQVLQDVSEEFKPVIIKETQDGHEETVRLEAIDDESAPVIRLVNSILNAALQKRASDIHIEAFEHGIEIKNRIDGVLYSATEVLDRQYHAALISRLKVMSELDIAEKRIPQDGRFKLRIGKRNIDFRVSILPSVYGEDIVIRILDKSSLTESMQQLSLNSLGLAEKH